MSQVENTSKDLFGKTKTLHFCIFGCKAYVFLLIKICANKLTPHSELIIFIRYKNNGYHFMCHTQGNICQVHE